LTGEATVTEAQRACATARSRVAGVCGALVLGGIGLPTLFGGPVGAATTASSLAPFLLRSHEEPGFTVSGHPTTITKPSELIASGSLTKSESKSFVSTLQKAGFVKAVEENTTGSGSNEGLSLVIQFTNPAGAQAGAALFLQVAKSGQTGAKLFSVTGVPGAKGVTVTGGAGGSANAYWSAGDCAFGSGAYEALVTSAKAAASPVQAGIRAQAERVGTTCP
jgi:hypothetical protein